MAFNREQIQVFRELASAPQYAHAGPKVQKAEAETGIVESGLQREPREKNLDSIGTLQQRPSQGWGTPQQLHNVRYQSEQFLKRAIPLAAKYGSAGQLAQAVQRSAFPERYDEHGGEAMQLLKQLGGSTGGEARATPQIASATISSPEAGPSSAQSADIVQLLQTALQPQQSASAPLAPPRRPITSGGSQASAEGPKIPQAPAEPNQPQDSEAILELIGKLSEDAEAPSESSAPATPAAGSKQTAPVTSSSVADARGAAGFTAAPGTIYNKGALPQISQRLNVLGQKLGIKLTGISGYRTPAHSVAVGGFADDPHTKAVASDTPGVESVPKAVLNHYGLERPFPGAHEADHIQLLHSVNANGGY